MRNKLLVLVLLCCAVPAGAANLLYSQNFEGAGWTDGFTAGTGNIVRSANNPHGGTYCIRGNLDDGVTDPIEGSLTGENNPQLVCNFNDVSTTSDDSLFIRYWVRMDNCNYVKNTGPAGWFGKYSYIGDDGADRAVWFSATYGLNYGRMQWAPNNAAGPMSVTYVRETLGWDVTMDMDYTGCTAPQGQWNKVEILFDYINDEMLMWVNGCLAVETVGQSGTPPVFSDGKVPMNPTFKIVNFQFWHITSSNYHPSSSHGPPGEYMFGWQIDDIEAWDGWPGDILPPPPGDPPIAPVDSVWAETGGG